MASITISRQHGSTGREIGQYIASEMGYEYVDRERLLKDISVVGKDWEKWLTEFEEHAPSIWERYDWSFRGFVALQHNLILKYVLKDRAVIMARGANFLLKDVPYVLKLRFEAPLENRIENVVRRENVARDTAKFLIEKLDKESAGYIKQVFHKTVGSPEAYDIIFNTSVQSREVIIDAIKQALEDKESFNTAENKKLMELWVVASNVRTGILTNPKYLLPTLEVIPEGNGIILRGLTHTPKEHKEIEAEARRLAGNVPVKCELHYR